MFTKYLSHTYQKDIAPIVSPPRRVPIALRHKLKSELSRMTHLDVIEPVNDPSEWVNPLVLVEKPNGQLRICLDPQELNKAIKRHHFKLPTPEELFSEMSGAKYFTKLDASSGYWQIKVDHESSKLLTFATPFGRYRFKRLPFGILSASEIFQSSLAEIISGIEGVRNSQDDIIIWGENIDILNARTHAVLQKIKNSGMKLNKNKCLFAQLSLTFLGHKLSGEGVSPDHTKVKAIQEMPNPECWKDLERFLGMVAYLAKFIPNLSEKTHELRL